jgi:hypothetical protein
MNKTNQSTYRDSARKRQTNPRTERQLSQRREFFEFARNWTRELIIIWSNNKQMWASVTFIWTRQTNPRTEPQLCQRRKFSQFARNGTRELIISCPNRMASKCEQAWHSYEQDKPIHIPSDRWVNHVSSPSSLGIEFVSWLWSVQIEWPGNVSKRDIHIKKMNQSTYRATAQSTTWVLRARSGLDRWVDYTLFK